MQVVKRQYIRRNPLKISEKTKALQNNVPIGRYETSLLEILKEDQPFFATIKSGTLPFLIGQFVQRYGLDLVTPDGRIRKRFIKSLLMNLQSAGRIRFTLVDPINVLGEGQVVLV